MLFTMKTLGQLNDFKNILQINNNKKKYKKLTKIICTWHVHKSEQFQYPMNDVILKRWKELVKTMFITGSGKSSYKIVIKSMTEPLMRIMFVEPAPNTRFWRQKSVIGKRLHSEIALGHVTLQLLNRKSRRLTVQNWFKFFVCLFLGGRGAGFLFCFCFFKCI